VTENRTQRQPFDPPYTPADVPRLDALHWLIGLGAEWMESDRRAEILAGSVGGETQ
jgi:hypothetical protein